MLKVILSQLTNHGKQKGLHSSFSLISPLSKSVNKPPSINCKSCLASISQLAEMRKDVGKSVFNTVRKSSHSFSGQIF